MSHDAGLYHIDAVELKTFAAAAAARAGIPETEATILADTLVEADLRGVDSHGIQLLAPIIRMIGEGNMNPRPSFTTVKETPLTAVLDGDNGIGNLVCAKAAALAIGKASCAGVGIVTARKSTHCGALAYYPMMALQHDMIGFMTVNGPPLIPPYGGITRLLSTNPYAAAIPAGTELPVVVDMAVTVAARTKIRLKAKLGEKIPLGWALDRYSQPTEDATEALHHGFLNWMGGAKGYSMAVLANILSGVLSGCTFGPQNYPPYDITADYGSQLVRQSQFIMVLNISYFIPLDEFKSRMDAMIQETRTSQPAKGFDRVYLPGEPEFERKAQRLKTGIPVSHPVWQDLQRLRQNLGISTSLTSR